MKIWFMAFLCVLFSSALAQAGVGVLGPQAHGMCRCHAETPVMENPFWIELTFTFPPLVPCNPETLIPKCHEFCREPKFWNKLLFDKFSLDQVFEAKHVYLDHVEGYCLSNPRKKQTARRIFERHVVETIPFGEHPTPNLAIDRLDFPVCISNEKVEEVVKEASKLGILSTLGVLLLKYVDRLGARAIPTFMTPMPLSDPTLLITPMEMEEDWDPRADNLLGPKVQCVFENNSSICMNEKTEVETWHEEGQVCYEFLPRS